MQRIISLSRIVYTGASKSALLKLSCIFRFGFHHVLTQVNTVYSSSPELNRPSYTLKPATCRTCLHVSSENIPNVQ